jgi:opacity protein-like surface antigen
MFASRRVSPLAVLLLAVGLGAGLARADEEEDFARRGAYVAVGASRAFNLIEAYLDDTPILKNLQAANSWGVNARAGYRVASFFALEGEYEWIGDVSARLGGVEIARIGTQIATANFRLVGPFGRFQPYFLGGFGGVFFDSKGKLGFEVANSALAGRVGLGVDLYVTPHVLANLGVEGMLTNAKVSLTGPSFSVSEHGLGFVTLQFGLGYRF